MRRALRAVSLCVVILTAAMNGAAARGAGVEVLQAGFDGVYRTGSWTPLVIGLGDGATGAAYASVEDPDGQWVTSPPMPIEVAADGRAIVRFCVRFGRPSGRVLVHREPEPTAASSLSLPAPIPSTDTVQIVLGDLVGIDRAARLLARDDGSRPRVVVAPRDGGSGGGRPAIATTPRDLDGVDALLACGRDVLVRDPSTLAAIDAWVRRGGRLVFMAGTSAADIASAGGPAASWLPGRLSRMTPLRRSAPIEVFARCTRPMERSLLTGLEVPVFDDAGRIDGVILAHDGAKPSDLPLVVRRGHGLGTITWIGLDLDQAGFKAWPGTDTLLVELLGGLPKARGRAGETSRITLDLAGQLRRAIDRFSGIGPVPFSMIALLGGLSIASLYPLTWWLVRQAAPPVAWAILPLVSVATAGIVWQAGRQWHGAAWRESAASVIDIDALGGLARGTSWAGVWSPVNAAIDVAGAPATGLDVADADTVISWYADAGRGLGATDAPVAHPSLAAADYRCGATAASFIGVPIAASSSRLFEAEWVGRTTTPPVAADLAIEAQGTLRGTLVHHLPFPLERCVLVHAGWLYSVGRLEPGQPYDPSVGRGPRSLVSALTRRTQNKDRDVVARWDTSGTDIEQILEIAGFHAAAGGSGYTSLEPGRLGRLDLSPQLEVGRAVLVGFGPAGTDWALGSRDSDDDGVPSSGQTMWRILMRLRTGVEASQP